MCVWKRERERGRERERVRRERESERERWVGRVRVRNIEGALEVDRVPKVQNLCIYLSIYLSIYIRKQIYI